MIKQAFFALILLALPVLLSAKSPAPSKEAGTATVVSTQAPSFKPMAHGVRAPFANEEAKYYNKAWPIKESHSLWALILMGSVVVVIFTLLIRKMARSKPRQPEK